LEKGKANADRSNDLITLDEAKRLGIPFDEPEPMTCPFCGKELPPLGMEFMGRVRWVARGKCGCEGEAEAAREAASKEQAEQQRQAAKRVIDAGVKPRFANAVTSHPFVSKYLVEDAMREGLGLYIHGGVGSGKTYTASALARALVYEGESVIMTTSIDMLDEVKSSYGESFSSEGTSRFRKCDVLIIDDLGKEGASSWVLTTLFQIVNGRYESLLPTIVTSQYSLEGLERRMSRGGETETARAIVSRVRETCTPIFTGRADKRADARNA
jgi:DNA replication protein DnaC